MTQTNGYVFDVDTGGFAEQVVDRSHETPVVVDFWAAWCGPCKTLGPILERAVEARGGEVVLAKVDVDANQELAQRFGIRGIPAVKGFRDGEVVAEFVGAQGPAQVEAFLDQLVPSEADRLVAESRRLAAENAEAAEAALRQALTVDSGHRQAAIALADLVIDRDPEEALRLVGPHRPDPEAEQIAALASLASSDGDREELRRALDADPNDQGTRLRLGRALAAAGQYEEATDELLEVVRRGGEERDAAREQLLDIFRILGDDHPLVGESRRRLASALY
jgi:putative thioredoxin